MTDRRRGSSASSKPPRPTVSGASEPIESGTPVDSFNFEDPVTTRVSYARRRRRTPIWQRCAVWGGVLVVLAAIGYGGWLASQPSDQSDQFALQSPGDQTIDEESPLSLQVGMSGTGFDPRGLEFGLVDAPSGATIDTATGEFHWTPGEEHGPGTYSITVRASAGPSLTSETTVVVAVNEVPQPPSIEPIDEQIVEIDGGTRFVLDVKASDPDLPASSLTYSLESAPIDGATIDASSGRFELRPGDAEAGVYPITVKVAKTGASGLHATQTFDLRIVEPSGARQMIRQLARSFRDAGLTVSIRDREPVSGFDAPPQVLQAGDEHVLLLAYDSDAEATDVVSQIPAGAASLLGNERVESSPLQLYRKSSLLAVYQGEDEQVLDALTAGLGDPVSTVAAVTSQPVPPPTPEDVEALLAMLDNKSLFNTKQYPAIRSIFANRFESEFTPAIEAALGDDYEELQTWFEAHTDFEQELYTAIDPQHDDLAGAITLFNVLRKEFPEEIEKYGELAIAIAVTWDRERGGIYEYDHHARRTSSNYEGEFLDGPGNFRYFVESEALMQGRVQFMPHEFLVHLVNHRTPVAERSWAMQNYGNRRTMFGQCYSDVPYDDEMLRTSSAVCRLNGQDYVLPNIRRLGGVCAMQADFAARVGKSMGVPAEYISGESIYGDRHAWVMWVELKSVTRNNISFSLESHGRYRGDKYYVGEFDDPQTGRPMTDRELELRLYTAGSNPLAARQANLVMKAYPLLCEAGDLDQEARLSFLNKVIDLSPGNEAAWQTLAAIPKNETIEKSNRKLVLDSFDRLFRTFANFPDFTWKVFGDLVSFVDDERESRRLYERLVVLYEAAGRPDLACEARMTLTDRLLAADETVPAINGLAFTIRKFPDEGRYVPRMLDKLEAICAEYPESGQHLVRFYTEFLPAIPRTRGDEPSKYCIEMYQRAVALFRDNGQPQLATALSGELAKIQANARR